MVATSEPLHPVPPWHLPALPGVLGIVQVQRHKGISSTKGLAPAVPKDQGCRPTCDVVLVWLAGCCVGWIIVVGGCDRFAEDPSEPTNTNSPKLRLLQYCARLIYNGANPQSVAHNRIICTNLSPLSLSPLLSLSVSLSLPSFLSERVLLS